MNPCRAGRASNFESQFVRFDFILQRTEPQRFPNPFALATVADESLKLIYEKTIQ